MMTIEEHDRVNELLNECETISALLWDSEDTGAETAQNAGVMLHKRITEIKEVIT